MHHKQRLNDLIQRYSQCAVCCCEVSEQKPHQVLASLGWSTKPARPNPTRLSFLRTRPTQTRQVSNPPDPNPVKSGRVGRDPVQPGTRLASTSNRHGQNQIEIELKSIQRQWS